MKTKLFFDMEFTGLRQDTTLISLGIISECGKTFYAEFTDYDVSQLDDWLVSNVLANLTLLAVKPTGIPVEQMNTTLTESEEDIEVVGTSKFVLSELKKYLSQFTKDANDKIIMWSDCLSYDWVLFNNLFGRNALDLPHYIDYIPRDICTTMDDLGIDPDISREEFAYGYLPKDAIPVKHNAMWDAIVIKACHEKLTKRKGEGAPFIFKTKDEERKFVLGSLSSNKLASVVSPPTFRGTQLGLASEITLTAGSSFTTKALLPGGEATHLSVSTNRAGLVNIRGVKLLGFLAGTDTIVGPLEKEVEEDV